MNSRLLLSLAFLLTLAGPPAWSQEAGAAGAASPAAPKIETFRISRETLRIEVGVSGVLEAEKKSEVMLEPEAWTGFVVKKAVEHGERVKKDDPLIIFETDKIDEEIRDLKAGRELALLAIRRRPRRIPGTMPPARPG